MIDIKNKKKRRRRKDKMIVFFVVFFRLVKFNKKMQHDGPKDLNY